MLTPTAFTQRYGVPGPDVSRSPRLAALRLLTDSEAPVRLAGIDGTDLGGRTVVNPKSAMGAALIFETARTGAR